jgi:hypothetical protein
MMFVACASSTGNCGGAAAGRATGSGCVVPLFAFFGMLPVLLRGTRPTEPFGVRVFMRHLSVLLITLVMRVLVNISLAALLAQVSSARDALIVLLEVGRGTRALRAALFRRGLEEVCSLNSPFGFQ